MQEAFLKAYRYQIHEEIQNWGGLLHRFAVNVALDHIKKRRTCVPMADSSLVKSDEDPAGLAELSDLAKELRRTIAKLPLQQSKVFCLATSAANRTARLPRR